MHPANTWIWSLSLAFCYTTCIQPTHESGPCPWHSVIQHASSQHMNLVPVLGILLYNMHPANTWIWSLSLAFCYTTCIQPTHESGPCPWHSVIQHHLNRWLWWTCMCSVRYFCACLTSDSWVRCFEVTRFWGFEVTACWGSEHNYQGRCHIW